MKITHKPQTRKHRQLLIVLIVPMSLRALTPAVVLKLEFGLNDDGDTLVTFGIGDRF